MKIGILTFHRSRNYGALLQAKALQDFLRIKGYDVSFVDYWPSYHAQMYDTFSWSKFKELSLYRKITYIVRFALTFSRNNKRQMRTESYVKKYLSISDDTVFDAVIYGSDQIWRKQHKKSCPGFNPVFWGDGFVETNHKIAYAASMGLIEINNDEDRLFIEDHVKNFDAISIRESDLIERLSADFGVKYPLVCDPVFLLNKEQWLQHVDSSYIPKNKYILYYRLQPLADTDNIVKDLHRKTGYKVVELRGYIPYFNYGSRYRTTADAQEFVSLISGAEYVVTTAFHGVALSIVLEKQFVTSSKTSQSSRVLSLLSLLGLTNRFVKNDKFHIDDKIDYTIVSNRLSSFATESREWLLAELKKIEKA